MSGQTLIASLDGAPLVRWTSSWQGFFEGEVSIENLRGEGGLLRFDLILPTHQSDINDFIWTSEVEAATTEKVVLTQAGAPVPGARVTGIRREGAGKRWTHAPSEQYRIEFGSPCSRSIRTTTCRCTSDGVAGTVRGRTSRPQPADETVRGQPIDPS